MASSPTLLILLIFTVTGTTTAELTQNFFHQSLINHGKNSKPNIPYKTQFFPQLLDHFTFKPQSYKIFYQKYLINKKYWNHGGPIFVYTGNEGDIDWFAANTGFMLDIAPKFQALLVFIEHRFYGESLPFGKDSYKSAETLGYLNSQQALADFAVLIRSLKQNLSSEASPVVVFGGSYGGMLSVWFRMKYPHLAIGAVASSAPILQFDEIIPWTSFYDTVSQDYKDASWNCYEVIKGSWAELQSLSTLKDGMSKISKIFRTCKNLQSVYSARDWLWKVFVYTAMANYPTEANFMMPLPAYPVTKMCKIIDGFPPKATKLNRVLAAANLYYNYTGTQKCFDLENRTDNHGLHGWNWQSCTEMVMPMTTSNDSMFPPITFNIEELGKFCMKRYGAMPRPHWITTEFGGYRFEQVLKRFGSNIIFSNGMQDPWSRGRHGKDEIFIHPYQSYARTTPSWLTCVLKNISDSIIALVTEKGAHHVDFRFARKDDPDWLVEQRRQEVGIIQRWIDDYYADLSFL